MRGGFCADALELLAVSGHSALECRVAKSQSHNVNKVYCQGKLFAIVWFNKNKIQGRNFKRERCMYRIGFPLWKAFARLGAPLKLRVNVIRDEEAGVFVATSDDLRGLVAEAATLDELVVEVHAVIEDLLAEQLKAAPQSQPVTDLRFCAA